MDTKSTVRDDSFAPEMDLKEFTDAGYLLEANRRFFHPLGLALNVRINDDREYVSLGVYDVRDDPEGFRFGPANTISNDRAEDRATKLLNISNQEKDRRGARYAALGYWIQPAAELLETNEN